MNQADQKQLNALIGMGLSLLLVGVFAGLFYSNDVNSDWPVYLQWIAGTVGILSFPGLIVGMIFGGTSHDPNMVVAAIADWMFYSIAFYFIAKRWRRA